VKRRYVLLGIDLFWVALSPFVALFIRENFTPRAETLTAAITYALVGLVVGALVLSLAGLNRGLWRYTSLPDLLRLVVAVTAIVLLSLFTTFAFSRLQDIARSLPVIQWFVLLACMAGSRLAIRIWQEKRWTPAKEVPGEAGAQNVLVVGVNQIGELYLRSVAEFAPRTISIVGILASGVELPGRLWRSHKVLGQPEDLQQVVRQLEVHGAPLDRVIVVEPPPRLSSDALDALLALERSSTITVEWISELLGFGSRESQKGEAGAERLESTGSNPIVPKAAELPIGWHRYAKRLVDLLAAVTLIVVLTPLSAALAVLIAIDVGFPIVFWQKRPGRYGRSFKLYKFRTMRGAHDRHGNRIPDQERSSKLGVGLRRTRLDELPQLYNILVGEMSFVGPRPLLPCDQPDDVASRLSVRPGLTGLAQVYGDRTMPPNDKNTLDMWYIQNASLWLDTKIMLRTVTVFIRGERLDLEILQSAREAIQQLKSQDAIGPLMSSGRADEQAEIIRSVG